MSSSRSWDASLTECLAFVVLCSQPRCFARPDGPKFWGRPGPNFGFPFSFARLLLFGRRRARACRDKNRCALNFPLSQLNHPNFALSLTRAEEVIKTGSWN